LPCDYTCFTDCTTRSGKRDGKTIPVLSLSLLMARIGANYVNPTFSADDFTAFANAFDAGADLHR